MEDADQTEAEEMQFQAERDLQDKLDISKKEVTDLFEQVLRFSELIIEQIPGKPNKGESTVDFAYRLLTEDNKTKDDKIVKECKKSGEPYIVFRAKDNLSVGLLQFYMMRAVDEKCPNEFVEQLKLRFNDILEWRKNHPYRTRMPD